MAAMPNTTAPTPLSDPTTPIRVAVVEDDAACRIALVAALNAASDMRLLWALAGRAEALAALNTVGAEPPDVLLVDLGLPDGSGLEVIAAARARWPDTVSMVSTIFGDEAHVLRAIEAGALGYLLKDLPAPAVVDEIRNLHAGGSPISPMVARKLLLRQAPAATTTAPSNTEADSALSSREVEVLRLVARGFTLDEVATSMGVSRHTVRSFVRRLYAKLQVKTRAQAVHAGVRQGLIHG